MGLNENYKKRLNRYGGNSLERLTKGREENFKAFRNASPHRVTFTFKDKEEIGVLEPHRQDEDKSIMHLLIDTDFQPEIGSILDIVDDHWLVYWLDDHKNRGYNRWALLRLNKEVEWRNPDGSKFSSLCYMYGQQNNMLKNEVKSRSRSAALYQENLKLSFMIMPAKGNIGYGSYLEVEDCGFREHFRVTGYDFLSTPGIVYVSLDPTLQQTVDKPKDENGDGKPDLNEDDYWLGGLLDV